VIAIHDTRPARRLPLAALAATLLTIVLPTPASAAPAAAHMADTFVDSIGVNTHTYYNDTVYYSRFATVKQRLAELGIRHVRENLVPDRPDQYERLGELSSMGIKSTLIVGDPNEGRQGLEELVSILRTDLRGDVAAAEGPNEFDMWGGGDWLPRLSEYQRWLYDAIKSDPALSGLPVVGPSIVHHRNQEALGDVSGQLDYGNIHSYPDGYSPESNLDRHFEHAAKNSGSKQLMATESGYHSAVGWDGEHNPVSEDAMATYIPRMYLEYFRRGVARTFSYELLDEAPGASDREDSFGLLRNDLSPKPAFDALRNTIQILSDPGPAFAPATLDYTLSGNSKDVHHMLLQKRDGSFYLALWRDADVWDPESQTPLAAPSGNVTVDFGRLVTSAEAYVPNVSAAPLASLPIAGSAVNVEVGAQAVVVKVTAGGPKPERLKFWVSKRSVPAGGRVAVRGRLPSYAAGRPLRIAIQHRRNGRWRTVGRGRTTRSGIFKRAIRLSRARYGAVPKLRLVARKAKPSRPVRVRIKRRGAKGKIARLGRASAVSR
jgi:hypothetical protein